MRTSKMISVILFSVCFFTSVAFGNPIFQIVPDVLQVTIPAQDQSAVTYTVTNQSATLIGAISIEPTYGIAFPIATVEITNNTCATSIVPAQTCEFTVMISNNLGQVGSFSLSPRVCGFNGAICSVPNLANRILVTLEDVVPPPLMQLSYVSSAIFSAYIHRCDLSNGELSSCVEETDGPQGVTDTIMDASSTYAYLLDTFTNILTCPVNSGIIDMTNCQTTVVPNLASSGAAINNGYLFVTLPLSDQVASCPIVGASLGVCALLSDPDISTPRGRIGFKTTGAGTFAYIASNGTSSLTQCLMDGSGGFTSCNTLNDPNITEPIGVQLNPAGDLIYIANDSPEGLAICPVDSNGNVGSCDFASDPSFLMRFVANLFVSTDYVYVPNSVTGTVSSCPISGNTILPCIVSTDPLDEPTGVWVTSN